MSSLKPLSLDELNIVVSYLDGAPNICDFSVGTLYTWKDYYRFEITQLNHCTVVYSSKENSFFPSWQCSAKVHVELLKQIGTLPFTISPVPESLLEQYLPYGNAVELAGWADYLYSAEELINLVGKKFHGKRNHIARFNDSYSYTFEPVANTDLPELTDFVSAMGEGAEGLSRYDVASTLYALANLNTLGLLSGVLRVDGRVVGLTLGEICGDTLIVHTERCDRSISGGYEKLAHLFVSKYGKACQYVNREEDLGNEGLRRAKQSWQPVKLLKKYAVEITE